MIAPTGQQQQAVDAIHRWHKNPQKPFYYLGGAAGTGKSSLAKIFAEGVSNILYAAFTGKAASVMAAKGCIGAQTIHSLIYSPSPKSQSLLRDLHSQQDGIKETLAKEGKTEKEIAEHKDVIYYDNLIAEEQKKLKRPSWKLNPDSPLKDAELLIVDECSQVDGIMGNDLLSFNVPVLVLGDPYQLPPVMGEGMFTKGEPDFLLTEIHRQAADSPVLQLAHAVREGRGLRLGQYGTSKVITKAQVEPQDVLDADQILVGTNKMRKACNARMRVLKGFDNPLPLPSDRLVCLKNNKEAGVLNGAIWTVNSSIGEVSDGDVELDITDESGTNIVVTAHNDYFLGEEPKFYEIRDAECFDYGYAITTHKAQGSEFKYTYIFDESHCFRQNSIKWLYTAITRGAERVTVVI